MRHYYIWATLPPVEPGLPAEDKQVFTSGAKLRDAAIGAALRNGASVVFWQELDKDGRELYPAPRMVKSRELKTAEARERREYRKVVRASSNPELFTAPLPTLGDGGSLHCTSTVVLDAAGKSSVTHGQWAFEPAKPDGEGAAGYAAQSHPFWIRRKLAAAAERIRNKLRY